MKANQEHLDNVDFVARYKEANKNTVYKSVYDPVRKLTVLVPVVFDINAYKFAEQNIISEAKAKRRSKTGVTSPSEAGKTAKTYNKITPEILKDIVRLINEGKTMKEISKMYDVSVRSAWRNYQKQKDENQN